MRPAIPCTLAFVESVNTSAFRLLICFVRAALWLKRVATMDRPMESWSMLQLVVMLLCITREIARRSTIIASPVSILWTREDLLGPNRPISADLGDGFTMVDLLNFDSPHIHSDDEHVTSNEADSDDDQDDAPDNDPDGEPTEPPKKKSRPSEMSNNANKK